jgi:hypothetical protein
VPTSVVLFDNSVLPSCMDQDLRTTLNAQFEKKWNANSTQFQRTLAELSARFEQEQVELAAMKEEYNRYKSRAQTVLAHQQTELAQSTQALEEARKFEREVDQLREQIARFEEEKQEYNPHRFTELQAQLRAVQDQLKAALTGQHEITARFTAQLEEAEKHLAEDRTRHETVLGEREAAHAAAVASLKEDLEKHRAKARELVTQKENQIVALQSKIKMGQHGSNSNLHATAAAAAAVESAVPSASAAAPSLPITSGSFDTSAMASSPIAAPVPGATVDLTPDAQYQLTALLASREEELSRARSSIRQLHEQLRTVEIHSATTRDREAELQRRIAEMERMAKRNMELTKQENVEYLKNVLVRYMETGDEVSFCRAGNSWSLACFCLSSLFGCLFVFSPVPHHRPRHSTPAQPRGDVHHPIEARRQHQVAVRTVLSSERCTRRADKLEANVPITLFNIQSNHASIYLPRACCSCCRSISRFEFCAIGAEASICPVASVCM